MSCRYTDEPDRTKVAPGLFVSFHIYNVARLIDALWLKEDGDILEAFRAFLVLSVPWAAPTLPKK
jgi:hypothetical protein